MAQREDMELGSRPNWGYQDVNVEYRGRENLSRNRKREVPPPFGRSINGQCGNVMRKREKTWRNTVLFLREESFQLHENTRICLGRYLDTLLNAMVSSGFSRWILSILHSRRNGR